MIYRLLTCSCIMIACIALGYGQQRQLHFEDKSGPFDIISGPGSEAGMVIYCAETIELSFASNKDKTVNVFKTEVKGSDKYYYLRMPVGESYDDRKLTIYAARYAPLVIEPRLGIKQLKTLFLYDPDVILQGCYNQTMKEGLEIFRIAQYIDAKAKYRLAAECSDAPASVIDDIEQKIAVIDTIIKRRRLADEYFTVGNYQKAYSNYQTAFAYNPDDRYVELRMAESQSKITGKPARVGQTATTGENDKKAERRRQRTFAISYETLYGASFGWYRDKKLGVYFAGRYFEGGDEYYNIHSDFSLSTGMTFRLFRMTAKEYRKPFGVWLSLGGGFGESSIYENYRWRDDDEYETGLFPEAGLLMKLSFFVLKYTYQYRLDYPDNIAGRNMFGIGLCF